MKIADEILEEFIELMENIRDNQFEIGDKLIELVTMHDEKKAEVINHVAGKLNLSASVLYDYYRIAEKWSPIHRQMYQSLDWTIYRNADPVEDRELLEQCIDEGWNASRFKEEKYPAMTKPTATVQKVITSINRVLDRADKENASWKRLDIEDRLEDVKARLESILIDLENMEQTEKA